MRIWEFEGHSDDTFGEYRQTNIDYDNSGSGKPIQFALKSTEGGGLIITGLYDNKINQGGCWAIAVESLNENRPVDWPVTMEPSFDGYRNRLTVRTPNNVILVNLNKSEDS